jgi:hypothetical protein
MSNYELFISTVESLKHSQGFYSRIAEQVNNMSDDERAELEEQLNELPQFKDSVDVIMYLET